MGVKKITSDVKSISDRDFSVNVLIWEKKDMDEPAGSITTFVELIREIVMGD